MIKKLDISTQFDYKFLTFIILIFFPKIDLITVADYWQGIRIEDLLLFIFFVQHLTNSKKVFWQKDYQYKYIVLFFTYYFFSNFIGFLSGISIMPIAVIRLAEYLILILFINSISINGSTLKKISAYYLLINLFISFMQELHFIGSFTSLGYLEPENYMNERAMGLSGGSWELGILSALNFFIYLRFEKKILYIFIFYIITLTLLFLSEGRANTIAFLFSSIFLIKHILPKVKPYQAIVFLTFLLVFIYFSIELLNVSLFQRVVAINYVELFYMLKNFILYNEVPSIPETTTSMPQLLSFVYRIKFWSSLYDEYNTSIVTQLFGTGMLAIYTESLLIRIWFTTGIVGLFFALLLSGHLKLYQFVFFIISGFSLDIFVSFKIFLTALILNKKTK